MTTVNLSSARPTARIGIHVIPGTGRGEQFRRPVRARRAIRALIDAQERGDWRAAMEARKRHPQAQRFPAFD